MAKKFASKALKVTSMSMGLMIGTMVAGAGLATAGWWFTDRLDLAMGEPAGINAVKAAGQAGKDCPVGQTATITYTSAENPEGRASTSKDMAEIVECVDGSEFNQYSPWGFVKNVYAHTLSGEKLVTKLVKREEIKKYQKDDGGWVGTGVYKMDPKKENISTGSKWIVKETMTQKEKEAQDRKATQDAAAAKQKAANSKAATERAAAIKNKR